MPFPSFFYPRIRWGSGPTDIDFTIEADVAVAKASVAARNTSVAGVRETLHYRTDKLLRMRFYQLDSAHWTALNTWFDEWASLGKQSAITLDRLSTCAGQMEFDLYNTAFDKAELENAEQFALTRLVPTRSLMLVDLVFRQGVAA